LHIKIALEHKKHVTSLQAFSYPDSDHFEKTTIYQVLSNINMQI